MNAASNSALRLPHFSPILGLSRRTNPSSATTAYVYMSSCPSRLRISSARSRRTGAWKVRLWLRPSKVLSCPHRKGLKMRASVGSALSSYLLRTRMDTVYVFCAFVCHSFSLCSRISPDTTDTVFVDITTWSILSCRALPVRFIPKETRTHNQLPYQRVPQDRRGVT